jgi:hypothetical protein
MTILSRIEFPDKCDVLRSVLARAYTLIIKHGHNGLFIMSMYALSRLGIRRNILMGYSSGRMMFAGDPCCNISEYQRKEFLGRRWRGLAYSDDLLPNDFQLALPFAT